MPSNCSDDSKPEVWQIILIISIILLLLLQIVMNSIKLFTKLDPLVYKILNPTVLGILLILVVAYIILSLIKKQTHSFFLLMILLLLVLGISIYFVVYTFISAPNPLSSSSPQLLGSSNTTPSTLYLYDKRSVQPLMLENKFPGMSSIQDVTHGNGTTLFLDENGTIHFLSDQGYQGSVPQNIKMKNTFTCCLNTLSVENYSHIYEQRGDLIIK